MDMEARQARQCGGAGLKKKQIVGQRILEQTLAAGGGQQNRSQTGSDLSVEERRRSGA
jgi:hypothetical protein